MAKERSQGRSGSGQGSRKRSGGSSDRRSSSTQRRRDEYPDYEIRDPAEIDEGPDVLLDVPVVKVDEIDVEVEDLRAAVSVRAELQDLVKLNVGVAAQLGKVELNIQGVEAQALLKARLDNVSLILGRVLTTLDRNPELLESVGRSVERVGGGTRQTLEGTGEAVEHVGAGGREALQDVGRGAGQAVGQLGEGAGQAVEGVGEGGGQAVRGVGQGAEQLTGQLAGQQGGQGQGQQKQSRRRKRSRAQG